MQGASLFRQAVSLVERGDLPAGAVAPGTVPVVAVAAGPRHPSNAVVVHMQRDSGPIQLVRAMPEAAPFQEGAQWFRAVLPPLEKDRRIDYQVELTRAGHRLATLPTDGSWLTMIGGPDEAAPSDPSEQRSPARPTGASPSSGHPRWAYDLTFFATLMTNFRPEILGETPEGYRINFFVDNGRLVGPRIDAVVRRDGGDWMIIRRDGIGVLDVRMTYETADGALILYQAGGVLDLGLDGYAKVAAGQFTGCPPLYATPTFMTAHPDWTWLNRCRGFEIGRVVMEKLQVQCDIYLPRVTDRRTDG
ncbi:MAG: DUF3237 domain-containing protein [Pseudonocardiaceae bacterium]